jgi:Tol biopolymer transport system component
MDSDGSHKRTVAPDTDNATVSPSGTRVAELSEDFEHLVLKTLAGTQLRSFRLPLGLPEPDVPPVWAPAEQAVAFQTANGIAVADTRTGVRLIHSHEDSLFGTAWSPDGHQIAFERATEGRFDLMVMRRDGTHLTRVARGTTGADAWSPDGQRLAFAREDGIYVVHPDGSARRRIAAESAGLIVWSPDGQRLAYSGAGISVVSVRGGPTRRITIVNKGDQDGLSWAPGERVLWSRKEIIWTGLPGSQPVPVG